VPSHYEILGVSTEATDKEIKEAYRSLIKRFHPDKNPDDPFAEHFSRLINEAYKNIQNKEKRENYNSKINIKKIIPEDIEKLIVNFIDEDTLIALFFNILFWIVLVLSLYSLIIYIFSFFLPSWVLLFPAIPATKRIILFSIKKFSKKK